MSKAFLLMGVVLCFSLTGCIPDKLNTEPEVKGLKISSDMQTFANPEEEFPVRLRPGDRFQLKLNSNPTTGYQWYVLPGWNDGIVDLIGDEYKSDPNPMGMVGVGGTSVFTFRAEEAGKTDIKLAYARGMTGEPVETHLIHVTVGK